MQWFVLLFIIIIFPFFCKVNLIIKKDYKLITFYIFFIRLFYIFIDLKYKGVDLILNKKIKKIPYEKIFSINSGFKILFDISILKIETNINVNYKKVNIAMVFFFNTIKNILYSIIKGKKSYIKIKDQLNLKESDNDIKTEIKINFVFNLIFLIESVIKTIKEKFQNG